MRNVPTWVAAVLLVVAAEPLAADGPGFTLFAGIQPGGSYNDERGVDADIGWSLGVELPVRGRWSSELMLSFEDLGAGVSEIDGPSFQLGDRQIVDLSARYRLGEARSWEFRGGLGLRYGHRDGLSGVSGSELWTTVASLTADWELSRRFSLRLDARHALVDLSGDGGSFGDGTFTTALSVRF